MKRWFRALVISIFAVAAIGLVVIQFVQMRRTFSISDNMFNVSVNNAMDEVIRQLNGEVFQTNSHPASAFNFRELDSLIVEELLVNGIDLHPDVGLYDGSQRSFLYSSDSRHEDNLEVSPYRYSFSPIGVVSQNQYFIILDFPRTQLFLQSNTRLYTYMSMTMLLVIAVLFVVSLRALSNQRKLDIMKSEFINNMTHEIKTPISTIGLACEMLRDDDIESDAEQRRNFLNIVSDENQRMRVLVETILQSAKMSNKNFAINKKEVNMDEVVARVAKSFSLTVSNRNGEIRCTLESGQARLFADELHVSNLVYNLVDNAIKYSPEHPVVVLHTWVDGEQLMLSVKDNGIGISKENQRHVFEKFYRVSTGNVHNVKGFGIGLNYVAQVVRLHHGRIVLNSELGEGTEFVVSLPIA